MHLSPRFSVRRLLLNTCISLAAPFSYAEVNQSLEASKLTGLTLTSISMLLLLSGVFLVCVLRLINSQNKLKENLQKLRRKNDELLEQKHQYLEHDEEILCQNLELEKRLTARTETVNKVNHELSTTLERLLQQDQKLNSLQTALKFSHQKILIIDKHYRICFANQAFLDFSGLVLGDIKDQPLKHLEKYVCLPEMAAKDLSLNKNGLFDTQLKCLDKHGLSHWLDAQIALSCSEYNEIHHYLVMFDVMTEKQPVPSH